MLQESLSGHSKSHQSICSNNVTTDIWGMMTKQPLNISFINWTSFKLYMLKWKETIRYVIYEWPGPEVPYLHACYLELDVTEHVSSSLLEIIYLCLVFFLFFVSLQVNKHSYVPEYCVTLTGRNILDFSHLYRTHQIVITQCFCTGTVILYNFTYFSHCLLCIGCHIPCINAKQLAIHARLVGRWNS